jgi:hypothetical protein
MWQLGRGMYLRLLLKGPQRTYGRVVGRVAWVPFQRTAAVRDGWVLPTLGGQVGSAFDGQMKERVARGLLSLLVSVGWHSSLPLPSR